MVFPVVMYGCESCPKKAECRRIDAFELWCWRRLLSIPWTARRSNQSILKEISPEYSLEGLMLKLKPQYFGHLMWRADSFEKALTQGEKGMTEDEMAGWHHQLSGHEFEWTLGVGDGQGGLECWSSWGRKESERTEQLHCHFSLLCTGEGNGNPLHCSCLENPRDGGAWWAAVYGVAQSRTRLKWLSSSSSSYLWQTVTSFFPCISQDFWILCIPQL